MESKTDAELIEEAEKLFSKPIPWKYESLSELAILASELASRLKAANEKLAGLTEIANQVANKRELKGQTREIFVNSGYEVKRAGDDGYLSNLPRKL